MAFGHFFLQWSKDIGFTEFVQNGMPKKVDNLSASSRRHPVLVSLAFLNRSSSNLLSTVDGTDVS